MKLHVTYFPMENKYSVWNGNILVGEWFNTREEANLFINNYGKNTRVN